MSRRRFLAATAGGAAGWLLPGCTRVVARPSLQEVRVGIIGTGVQGRTLMRAAAALPGIRVCALSDIQDSSLRHARHLPRILGHQANPYTDYRDMLTSEPELDAVIVATPDFVHAPHTVACLEAGLHVYCESPMSNTLQGAHRMAAAAQRTGRLLQIGHHRRGNPHYRNAKHHVLDEARLLGRLTHANAQWIRSRAHDTHPPGRQEIPERTLHRHGYETPDHLRHWRRYKRFGVGPMGDSAAHQIDVFNWFFDAPPVSVAASAWAEDPPAGQWCDRVMAILEYPAAGGGIARACCQALTAADSHGGSERFIGDEGSLALSEDPATANRVYREPHAPDWAPWASRGYLARQPGSHATPPGDPGPEPWNLAAVPSRPPHQPLLKNFFQAIREGVALWSPPGPAYRCTAVVLAINRAVDDDGGRLTCSPESFEI